MDQASPCYLSVVTMRGGGLRSSAQGRCHFPAPRESPEGARLRYTRVSKCAALRRSSRGASPHSRIRPRLRYKPGMMIRRRGGRSSGLRMNGPAPCPRPGARRPRPPAAGWRSTRAGHHAPMTQTGSGTLPALPPIPPTLHFQNGGRPLLSDHRSIFTISLRGTFPGQLALYRPIAYLEGQVATAKAIVQAPVCWSLFGQGLWIMTSEHCHRPIRVLRILFFAGLPVSWLRLYACWAAARAEKPFDPSHQEPRRRPRFRRDATSRRLPEPAARPERVDRARRNWQPRAPGIAATCAAG